MAKQILIIGHGFIGSALARTLSEHGHRVIAANRNGDDTADYPILAADLDDLPSLETLRDGSDTFHPVHPDLVIHCASSGRGGADAYRSVFLNGVRNLLQVFPDSPLLFTSSTSVYGQTDGSVVDETSPTKPGTETGQILVESERHVLDAGGIVLRLSGLYGAGRSIYLQLILQGTATIESGEVSRFLNQIHQDDVVGAISHLIEKGIGSVAGRCFNVVDDVCITQRECYEGLANFFELATPPEAEPDPNRKRAWTHKRVSNSLLRETGWQPIYPSFLEAIVKDKNLIPSIRQRISESPAPTRRS